MVLGRAVARISHPISSGFHKPTPHLRATDLQDPPGTVVENLPARRHLHWLGSGFHAVPQDHTLDVTGGEPRQHSFSPVWPIAPRSFRWTDWQLGPIQSFLANNDPILVGDEWRFYYSGRLYRHGPYAGPDKGEEKSIGFAPLSPTLWHSRPPSMAGRS
jgi:hypothetical protein